MRCGCWRTHYRFLASRAMPPEIYTHMVWNFIFGFQHKLPFAIRQAWSTYACLQLEAYLITHRGDSFQVLHTGCKQSRSLRHPLDRYESALHAISYIGFIELSIVIATYILHISKASSISSDWYISYRILDFNFGCVQLNDSARIDLLCAIRCLLVKLSTIYNRTRGVSPK